MVDLTILNMNKISQVAIVVKDIEKAMKLYWDGLGIGPWKIWDICPPLTTEITYRGNSVFHKYVAAETMVGDLNFELLNDFLKDFYDLQATYCLLLKFKAEFILVGPLWNVIVNIKCRFPLFAFEEFG